MRHSLLTVSTVSQTGFTTSNDAKYNYASRRQALRETWFPDSQEGLDRYSNTTEGMCMAYKLAGPSRFIHMHS